MKEGIVLSLLIPTAGGSRGAEVDGIIQNHVTFLADSEHLLGYFTTMAGAVEDLLHLLHERSAG